MLTRKSGQCAGKVQDVTSNGYYVAHVLGKNIRVHRIVWAMHFGRWPESDVDHIDGDPLNNRVENLRLATKSGNAQNRRSTSRKPSSPKGVRKDPRNGRYLAQIYVDNSRIFIGTFSTEDEAAHEYNKAAIKHHGEFARLNPVGV
jgi:hypothetical protein